MKVRKSTKLQQYLHELKANTPCMDCIKAGRDGIWPAVCMQFDHVPERGPKIGTVPSLAKPQTAKLMYEEIKKCDLICANCHFIRTSQRGPLPETRARAREVWSNPANMAKVMKSRLATFSWIKIHKLSTEFPRREWMDALFNPDLDSICTKYRRSPSKTARTNRSKQMKEHFKNNPDRMKSFGDAGREANNERRRTEDL